MYGDEYPEQEIEDRQREKLLEIASQFDAAISKIILSDNPRVVSLQIGLAYGVSGLGGKSVAALAREAGCSKQCLSKGGNEYREMVGLPANSYLTGK